MARSGSGSRRSALLLLLGLVGMPVMALQILEFGWVSRLPKPSLDRLEPPLPSLITEGVWMELGEDRRSVQPWTAGAYFLTLLVDGRPPSSPGLSACQRVARVLRFRAPPSRPHLRGNFEEVLLAFWLTRNASPEALTALWIENAPVGRGDHGLAPGMARYFDAPLQEAEPEQVALLLGLPQAPARYDPWRHPAQALQRRNFTLKRMAGRRLLTEEQLTRALAAPLGVWPLNHDTSFSMVTHGNSRHRNGGKLSNQSQISATISEATKEKLDLFAESHGLKKNFVVEQALLYFMEARRGLPDEALLPTRLLVEDEDFDRLAELVTSPPPPTETLRELMRGRDD